MQKTQLVNLFFYVPESHLEQVKTAVFKAGAGNIGNYSHCCWQVKGQGQFKPLDNSDAFIGKQNQLNHIEEYRVEIVLPRASLDKVRTALLNAHPYEEVAYGFTEILL